MAGAEPPSAKGQDKGAGAMAGAEPPSAKYQDEGAGAMAGAEPPSTIERGKQDEQKQQVQHSDQELQRMKERQKVLLTISSDIKEHTKAMKEAMQELLINHSFIEDCRPRGAVQVACSE